MSNDKDGPFGFPEEEISVLKDRGDKLNAMLLLTKKLTSNLHTLCDLARLGSDVARDRLTDNSDLGRYSPSTLLDKMGPHIIASVQAVMDPHSNLDTFEREINAVHQIEKEARVATESITKAVHQEMTTKLEQYSQILQKYPPTQPEHFQSEIDYLEGKRKTFELLTELPGEHLDKTKETMKQIDFAVTHLKDDMKRSITPTNITSEQNVTAPKEKSYGIAAPIKQKAH